MNARSIRQCQRLKQAECTLAEDGINMANHEIIIPARRSVVEGTPVRLQGADCSRRRRRKSPTSPVFYTGKARFLPACNSGHFPAAKGVLSRLSCPNSHFRGSKIPFMQLMVRNRLKIAQSRLVGIQVLSELVQIVSTFPAPTAIARNTKTLHFHQKV